jgi:hypothetical protein
MAPYSAHPFGHATAAAGVQICGSATLLHCKLATEGCRGLSNGAVPVALKHQVFIDLFLTLMRYYFAEPELVATHIPTD